MERRHALILSLIAFVSILDGMDGSIVNVALPELASSFGCDTGTISWVTVSYFMAVAGFVLLFGKIASKGYVREVLICGLITFGISSLVCGMSTNLIMLIIARIVQGTGAAMMGCTCAVVCVRYLSLHILALGQGTIAIGSSVGYTIGPAVGGILVDLMSWHWAFFINVPLCIMLIPIALHIVKKEPERDHSNIDVLGGLILFAVMGFGIYALERTPYSDERTMVLMAGVVFVISLALFLTHELRSKHPLINPRIFSNRRFALTVASFFVFNLGYMGFLYLVPFFLRINLGISISMSGMYLLIPSIMSLAFTAPVSRSADRNGYRWYAVGGGAVFLISMIVWYFAGLTESLTLVLLALPIMGFSWAFCGSAMPSRPIRLIKGDSAEMAASIVYMVSYVGGAVGTAIYALLFTAWTKSGHVDFNSLSGPIFQDGLLFCALFSVILAIAIVVMCAIVKDEGS